MKTWIRLFIGASLCSFSLLSALGSAQDRGWGAAMATLWLCLIYHEGFKLITNNRNRT